MDVSVMPQSQLMSTLRNVSECVLAAGREPIEMFVLQASFFVHSYVIGRMGSNLHKPCLPRIAGREEWTID